MGSLRGFGNTFGDNITNVSLNNLAANTHGSRTMMSEGIMFNAIAGGTVYNDQQEVVDVNEVTDRCPFAIYNLTYNSETDHYTINVWPGTVNNLVPDYDNILLTVDPPPPIRVFEDGLTGETTTNYVYIKCGNIPASEGTPAQYPVHDQNNPSKYPFIIIETETKTDTDDYSYFLIGIVQGSTDVETDKDTLRILKTMGCNSLWTERFKCGTQTAQYWWSAV